jgi:type II secretory pathway component PulC
MRMASSFAFKWNIGQIINALNTKWNVVVRLNNTDIKDAKQFNGLVAKLDTNKNALLLVRRGDSSQFIPLRPSKP